MKGSEGPSDFDVRHRFSINGTYELPFHGNQFVEGWQITGVFQGQSGSPINVLTNINTLTGVTSLRPDLIGDPTPTQAQQDQGIQLNRNSFRCATTRVFAGDPDTFANGSA